MTATAYDKIVERCAPDPWVNPDQVSRQYVEKIATAKCQHEINDVLADCCASLVGRIRGQMEHLLAGEITEASRASLQSLLDDANAISHTHYGNADELAYCISIGEHPGAESAEGRACARCGDLVHTLSSDDLCDGCVAEQVSA